MATLQDSFSVPGRAGTNPPVITGPMVSGTVLPDPAPVVSVTAPVYREPVGAQVPPYRPVLGRAPTPCEMGLCGPEGQIGVPGNMIYRTDGGRSVLVGPDPGGRSVLSQLAGDATLRSSGAGFGNLAQSMQNEAAYGVLQAQQTPQWNQIFNEAMARSGDPSWATAQANAALGMNDPYLTARWAGASAPADTQRVYDANSRAAAAYAVTGDPRAVTNLEGAFSPGMRVAGGGNGTLSVALGGGHVVEGVPVGPALDALAFPTMSNTGGVVPIVDRVQQRANDQSQYMLDIADQQRRQMQNELTLQRNLTAYERAQAATQAAEDRNRHLQELNEIRRMQEQGRMERHTTPRAVTPQQAPGRATMLRRGSFD